MGTNFYLKSKRCDECGHVPDPMHIGKSSAGWKFCFEASRFETKKDWFAFLEENQEYILDEYDEKVSLEDFKKMVEIKKDGLTHDEYEKKYGSGRWQPNCKEWIDDGARFYRGEFC